MAALLHFSYYNGDGRLVHSGQTSLPESLDWKDIDEKEVFIRYMGGMPADAQFLLIKSQGQQKMIWDLDDHKDILDHQTYRRKIDGAEEHLDRRCRELGIDRSRKPRNQ